MGTPTMKAFVAVALAAAAQAAPEADPQVLLAQPLVYGNAHTQVHAQVKHANGAVVPDDTLSVKAAKVQHLAAKATAYLNKPLVYTHPVVQTVAAPLVHQTVASPVVSYTGAYPHVYGTHFIKREAEAEAEADPYFVNHYTGVYSGVHHVAQPVTYTTGLTHHVPYVAKTVVPTTVVKPVVSSVYNYGLHTPLVNTHFIKREAEADPEALYYRNYGYGVPAYTTGYTGYTTGHALNYAYNPVYGYNNYAGYNGYAYGK